MDVFGTLNVRDSHIVDTLSITSVVLLVVSLCKKMTFEKWNRKESSFEKKDSRGVGASRWLGYLLRKLRIINSKHWLSKHKACIFKMLCPTSRFKNQKLLKKEDVFQFYINTLFVDLSGAFGGKSRHWDFIRDVGRIINLVKHGCRWSMKIKVLLLACS